MPFVMSHCYVTTYFSADLVKKTKTTEIIRIYLLFILHIENTSTLDGHDTIWTQEMQLSKLFIQVFPTKQSAITYSTLYSLVQVWAPVTETENRT